MSFLGERHILCVAHASQGLTSREIAEELGYSPRTIDGLIEDARRMLKARNRTHLVSRAVALGLIETQAWSRLHALSQRQLEVATAVADGLAGSEIAAKLGISEPTVSTHLVRAKRATGCRTSTALAALIASRDRSISLSALRATNPQEPAIMPPAPTSAEPPQERDLPRRRVETSPEPTELLGHSSTLVGRERELFELRQGLENALEGHCRLFLVVGESGAGKTALADAIGAEAMAAGATVLWGRAWDGGGAPSYWPWLRILRKLGVERDIGGVLATLRPEAIGRLTRLIPGLAHTPHSDGGNTADSDRGDSEAARFQLFDAIASLLRAAAADQPIVLILDDLHGADHPSLLLLGFLAVHVRDSPILVIGTYREAEARLDPQLAATLGDIIRHGQRLPLRGLRERDVGEVVERVAGRRPPERVVRAIHHATEGNPFFVDEVVRLLSAEGRLDDAAQVAAVRIPDGVRETIRHRLEPLADRTLQLLFTASVIGRDFRLDTLQRVSGADAGELDHALREAVDCGVIAKRPAGAQNAYSFSHGLIRETLYDDLSPERRGQLHRDVGLVLEELYAADPEPRIAELAHHFFVAATAGEQEKAIDYSMYAGKRAMGLFAYEQAVDHFERALQAYALQERADVPRRCDLLLALGTAQSHAGDTRAARETFLRAAGLARRLGSAERLARAAIGYGAGMGGFEMGRVDDGLVALLGEARDILGPQDDPLLARVLGRIATELYYSDRHDERVALGEQAVAMARRIGDGATLASTLSARFLTLWGPENSQERLQIASDVVSLGEEVRDRELVLRGHHWRVISLMELGDWVGADIELAVHARLAEELRDPLHLWHVPLFRATRALLEGRLVDAERLAGDAFAVGRGAQAQNAAQLYAVQLFALRTEQGRLSEVEPSLKEFARRYPAVPVWRAAAAFALAVLGRTEDARRAFEALAVRGLPEVPRDGEWLPTIALLVRTGAKIGDRRRTAALGELIAPYADQAVIAGRGAVCLGPVSRFAGIAAATAGRSAEAVAQLEHALAIARRWGAEPMVAGIRLELAEALDLSREEPHDHERRAAGLETARRADLVGPHKHWAANSHDPISASPPLASRSSLPGPGPAGRSDTWAFYRRGDIWTIGPPGKQIQLRDAKGLTHIARLLAAPHVEFHALDLVGAPSERGGSAAALAIGAGIVVRARGDSDAGPVLDRQAKAAYRARVAELQEEIDEAESFNDPERAASARQELAFVARELSGAVGLYGNDRTSGSDAERARINVTRAIRAALRRISEHDELLARPLDATIRTGAFCVYEPPPDDHQAWDLTGPPQ